MAEIKGVKLNERAAAMIGIGFVLLNIAIIVHARHLSSVFNLVTPLGVVLMGRSLKKGLEPWMLRMSFGALAAIVLTFVLRNPGRLIGASHQLLLVLGAACVVGAVGSEVPRKARHLAYGLLVAAAWAVTIPRVLGWDARYGTTTFLGMIFTLSVVILATLVYRAWALTGLPPRWLTRLIGVRDRAAMEIWGESPVPMRTKPSAMVVPSVASAGDTTPEVRTIST